MIESLDIIYKGKATIIKNKQFLSAKDYISPFVERLKDITTKFICYVKQADQVSYDNKNIDTVYNRVLITAVFPEQYDIKISENIYHRVVCMTYALDIRNPYCKFYTGVVDGDMNFYAFGSNCCSVQEIEPENVLDYTPIKTIITNGLNDQCKTMLTQLKDLTEEKSKILTKLGEWVDFTIKNDYINDVGKTKLSPAMAVEAYKRLMIDKDSVFYTEDSTFKKLNAFKAWSSQITEDDKDINSRYEKTQLVNKLLHF